MLLYQGGSLIQMTYVVQRARLSSSESTFQRLLKNLRNKKAINSQELYSCIIEVACTKEYIPPAYSRQIQSRSTFCSYLSRKHKQAHWSSLSEAGIKGNIHKLLLGIGKYSLASILLYVTCSLMGNSSGTDRTWCLSQGGPISNGQAISFAQT